MCKTLLDKLIIVYRKYVDYICILNDFNSSLLKIYKEQCENTNCVMQMDLKEIFNHSNHLPSDLSTGTLHYPHQNFRIKIQAKVINTHTLATNTPTLTHDILLFWKGIHIKEKNTIVHNIEWLSIKPWIL